MSSTEQPVSIEETPDFRKKNIPGNRRAVVAEFIATTLFVYVGCGAAVASQSLDVLHSGTTNDNTFLVSVGLAFGIGISVLAYAIAPISGGHINPAVTFAFVILGDMNPMLGIFYIAGQCVGAVLGAALVYGTFASKTLEMLSGTETTPFLLGMNSVAPGIPVGSAFLGEMMGTLLLVFTVLMTAVYKHNIAANIAPIAIGWSVFLAHEVLIPITGCGINPARTFGPMLVNIMAGLKVSYTGWWVYYIAPFVGSAIAAFTCKYLFGVLGKDEGIFGLDPTDDEIAPLKPVATEETTPEDVPQAAGEP